MSEGKLEKKNEEKKNPSDGDQKKGEQSKKRRHKNGKSGGKPGYKSGSSDSTDRNLGSRGYDSIHSNDIAWYNKNPILYNAATNVPPRTVIGIKEAHPISITTPTVVDDLDELLGLVTRYNQPSVISINFIPGFGVSDAYTSPANKCFQNIYSTMYSKTTGASLNFPQWELGLFTISVQSIAMLIACCKRALSTLYYRPVNNLAIPQVLLASMGIEFADLSANANNYVSRLNEIIQNFNTLKVPAFIDVFKRHYSLCNNVYMDEDNAFAQYYVFVPECWYLFSDLGLSDAEGNYDGVAGAYAYAMPYFGNPPIRLACMLNIIDKQIEAIRSSTDAANILGGLMRAFGDSELMELQPFEFFTVLEPVRDQIILEQINNCTPVGVRQTDTTHTTEVFEWGTVNMFANVKVTADPVKNIIISDYGIARTNDVFSAHKGENLVNFFTRYENDEYREHIMEATRLVPIPKVVTYNNEQRVGVAAAGTEVVTRFIVFTAEEYDDGAFYSNAYTFTGAVLLDPQNLFTEVRGRTTAFGFTDYFLHLMDVTKFKYHPRIYVEGHGSNSAGDSYYMYPAGKFVGDINFYTYIAEQDLNQLHNVAMLSVFDVTGKMPEGKPVR